MCANYITFVCCIAGDMVAVLAHILMVVCFWMIPHMIGTNQLSGLPGVVSSLKSSIFMDRIFTISRHFYVYGKMTCLTCHF